jgi:hypothetical protein
MICEASNVRGAEDTNNTIPTHYYHYNTDRETVKAGILRYLKMRNKNVAVHQVRQTIHSITFPNNYTL